MANEKRLIYAIRDTETGRLVSDINTDHRKYYVRFAFAENMIRAYNKRKSKPRHGKLEIVEFALEEVGCYAVD